MSSAAVSVRFFAFYLLALGVVLVVIPNVFLRAFSLATTDEVWIRVLGVIVVLLGYYYHRAARYELTEFIRGTVHGRYAVLACFVGFVVLGVGPPILILFGVVDAIAAFWTSSCLRSDAVISSSA